MRSGVRLFRDTIVLNQSKEKHFEIEISLGNHYVCHKKKKTSLQCDTNLHVVCLATGVSHTIVGRIYSGGRLSCVPPHSRLGDRNVSNVSCFLATYKLDVTLFACPLKTAKLVGMGQYTGNYSS